MKNWMSGIALVSLTVSLASCSQPPASSDRPVSSPAPQAVQTHTTPAPQASEPPPASEAGVENSSPSAPAHPTIGTVQKIVNGDLMCYVTLLDQKGVQQQLGATFDICDNQAKFLNQQVKLTYKVTSVNDCQSAEPCGKSRQASLISSMEVIGGGQSSSNSSTLSNGEWTITVSDRNTWTGVNNTGNLKYHGCDSKGNCIDLAGGRVSCRNGICAMGWRNGDYLYTIESPITDSADSPTASTLTVRQGDKVILKATGLKPVSP